MFVADVIPVPVQLYVTGLVVVVALTLIFNITQFKEPVLAEATFGETVF